MLCVIWINSIGMRFPWFLCVVAVVAVVADRPFEWRRCEPQVYRLLAVLVPLIRQCSQADADAAAVFPWVHVGGNPTPPARLVSTELPAAL